LMEKRSQLTVAHPRFHGDSPCLRVQCDHAVHFSQREEVVSAVGDAIEAMARAERLEATVLFYKATNLLQRIGTINFSGAIPVISRPIGEIAFDKRIARVRLTRCATGQV